MSERKTTCSSVNPSGILIGPTSANGTRRYSACPPGKPPSMCEYPNKPAGEWPMILAAIGAFGFEVSQGEKSPCWQNQHCPQEMVNGTTTRSPFLSLVTADPTSSTIPIGSCPR